jgi:hypothetical protein
MYPPNRSTGVGTINHRHSGPTAAGQTSEDTLEKQNDGMMSHLQSKITNLKNVSLQTWANLLIADSLERGASPLSFTQFYKKTRRLL